MQMLKGWISIYRKLRDSWIWKLNEPFDKRSAWIDLLLRANHKKAQIEIAGSILEVDAGELVTSMDQLAQEWKWSRHKVSNFLNRLEKERHVGTDKGQQKNTCKYYKL